MLQRNRRTGRDDDNLCEGVGFGLRKRIEGDLWKQLASTKGTADVDTHGDARGGV